MAYLNCALCPSQTYLYGHHHYKNGDAYAEYRCLSKHKTFIEETHGDDQRNSTYGEVAVELEPRRAAC